jgi:predicted GH43/DUF377 family glycosyl hydrolase
MKKVSLLISFVILIAIIIPGQAASVSNTPIPSNDWTKYPSNPVVDAGAPGSWDENYVIFPSVIKEGNSYMMWYRGVDAGGARGIGLANSGDGVIWTKDSANPVLEPGGSGSWDESINSARVIKDSPIYKMWYAASEDAMRIGYATSDDGKNWSKHPDNPVLDVGGAGAWDEREVTCPHIIKDGMTYKMWYTGKDNDDNYGLGYATSSNGTVWTKYSGNPVLTPGVLGAWDHQGVLCPSVLMNDSVYRMWYFGKSDSDPSIDSIGYATSPDGIDWRKDSNNPILEPGAKDEWDDYGVSGPSVILDNSTYKMWYQGWQGEASSLRIGYATSSSIFKIYLPIILRD